MSASDTGDEAPLVHFFNSVRNSESASAPASRTAATSTAESRARMSTRASSLIDSALASANRQPLDAKRRCIDTVLEFQIVGGGQRLEHLDQVACDRHLAYRIGDLAVLDPEPGGATAVVAGDAVDAGPDQVGNIEALSDAGDQFGRRRLARLEMKIVGPRRRRRRHAAVRMACGGEP